MKRMFKSMHFQSLICKFKLEGLSLSQKKIYIRKYIYIYIYEGMTWVIGNSNSYLSLKIISLKRTRN